MASSSSTSTAASDDTWTSKGVFQYFTFAKFNKDSDRNAKLIGVCNLCPGKVSISGRRNVLSNFILHMKVGCSSDFYSLLV